MWLDLALSFLKICTMVNPIMRNTPASIPKIYANPRIYTVGKIKYNDLLILPNSPVSLGKGTVE